MSKFAEWLRHVAAVLAGKAELIEELDAKVKAQVSWLKWRYAVAGTAAGFIAGYIVRGL